MFDSLGLSPEGCMAHDAELLLRLATVGDAVSLPDLFRGFAPRWAADSAERLLASGLIREGPDAQLELTASGRESMTRPGDVA